MIVTTGVTQSGLVISGTIKYKARVTIDPGYQTTPGIPAPAPRESSSLSADVLGGGDLKPSGRSSARRRYERRAGSATTRSV